MQNAVMQLHTPAEKLPANLTTPTDTLAGRTTASAANPRLGRVGRVQSTGSGVQIQDVGQADDSN